MDPMLKLKLKLKILLQKYNRGESFTKEIQTVRNYPLTQNEIIKQKELKRRNKAAAKKYRQKQKAMNIESKKEMDELEAKNDDLRAILQELFSIQDEIVQQLGFMKDELLP